MQCALLTACMSCPVLSRYSSGVSSRPSAVHLIKHLPLKSISIDSFYSDFVIQLPLKQLTFTSHRLCVTCTAEYLISSLLVSTNLLSTRTPRIKLRKSTVQLSSHH